MLDHPAEGKMTQERVGMVLPQFQNRFIPLRPGWRNTLVTFGLEEIQPVLLAKRGHVHAMDKQDGFGWHSFSIKCLSEN
jgi:hypothetical protein